MSNPVFSSNALFAKGARGRVRKGWGAASGYAGATPGVYVPGQTALAGPARRLQLDDVIVRTAILLGLMATAAAATWALVPASALSGATLLAALVAFAVGLVVSLRTPTAVPLIVTYALLEGAALGGISRVYDQQHPGLPAQALMATVITAAATLALYKTGWIRVTGTFMRFVYVATISYAAYALLNLILMLVSPAGSAFGPLYNGPAGLIVGLLAVVLAAANLLVDFESIKRAIEREAPQKFAWTAAFGLVVTLAWMYLEILRLMGRRR